MPSPGHLDTYRVPRGGAGNGGGGTLPAWLESWNEFTYALYLSLTENTLPLQVYYYVTRGNWFDAATYATLLTVPVMVVTACLQRYLKAGYLAGAIKG